MGLPIPERPVALEELYRLPDDGRRYELSAGRLLSEPLPGARHGIVTATIVALLSEFVRSRGLGVVLTADAGFILARSPDTMRGPDVAFVSRARFEEVGPVPEAFPGPPNLAVEVLSPSDRPARVHSKVAEYLAAGTRLVWVVDPAAERVAVYRSLLSPQLLGASDELDGFDVLPGFRLAVARFFQI
jgi:Uma2 family endonuclease